MNQYTVSSHTLHPQLSQFFLGSNQTMQHPLYIPSHFDKLIPSKQISNNDNLPFDSLAGPTKRVRHTQKSFSEAPINVRAIPHRARALQKPNLPQNPSQINFSVKEELTIPDVEVFSQNKHPNLINHPYQLMLQRLEQQRAQYTMQQQVLDQLERRQKQFESLMKQQFFEQQFGLRQNNFAGFPAKFPNPVSGQNMEETDASSTADILQTKVESSEEEEGFQYIKVENEFDTHSTKTKETEKSNNRVGLQQKDQPAKTKINKQSPADYLQKEKEQPRNKNKWQSKPISGEASNITPQETHVPTETIPKTRKPRQPKPPKPVDIPQHLQDDSNIDYQHLLSLTLTNDPAYITGDSRNKFVMISKNSTSPCETSVGARYQVSVPEYKGPVPGKRRHPKPVWRPEIVKENELQLYFDDLRNIFSCEMINEEEALRLLKSKKYRREKVRVNIGKSKKFYEKVLVVPTGNETTTQENTA